MRPVAAAALSAVLLTVAPAPATPAAHATEPGGRTHGDSERLRPGCHRYTYDYRVRTPYDDWTLETTIVDRRGDSVHADAFLGKPGRQGDPRTRRNVRFRVCHNATRPGVFRIRAKLTWYDHAEDGSLLGLLDHSPPEGHVVRLPVERFRLHR